MRWPTVPSALELEPSPLKTGAVPLKASLIKFSGLRIPSLTGRLTKCLPSKRSISTFLSAATITPSARAISSAVRRFLIPSEPFVSTLMSTPISLACFFKASSAM